MSVARFDIRFPRNDHFVGLAEWRIKDRNEVRILEEDVNGVRKYPYTYVISKEKSMLFPTQDWKGVKLRLIPISEFSVEKGEMD